MAKKLVIVESPAKAKTIEKFLGRDFTVLASMGHIIDLPKKGLGVNTRKDFAPRYETIEKKDKLINELREATQRAEEVYLAPDPDREGEFIAWSLKHTLNLKNPRRAVFHEITKGAVQEAIRKSRDINEDLFNAQQARRVLDRLVGYKISPLLWRRVQSGTSAGRVQSVALRLICDREAEIRAFVPEEYWSIIAVLSKKGQTRRFEANLISRLKDMSTPNSDDISIEVEESGSNEDTEKSAKNRGRIKISSQAEADAILAELKDATYRVHKVEQREQRRQPPLPYTTSTMQQDASIRLYFKPKKTMSLAQQLYEGIELGERGQQGLITYMRTDSTRISEEAQTKVKAYINEEFGNEYVGSGRVGKSKATTQDAHEAIRPTDVTLTPQIVKPYLNKDQFNLYNLIWRRFVASFMTAAIFDTVRVDIVARQYVFRANGSNLKFPGFYAVWQREEDEQRMLPPLDVDEELAFYQLKPEQHFTQPPPRYSEASLIKVLEEQGIGRPSTYVPIISTIQDRKYVEQEQRRFVPTWLGETVNELMNKHFPDIVDTNFTAEMERKLDEVEEGRSVWTDFLKNFYGDFKVTMEKAEAEMNRVQKPVEEIDETCPDCGRTLVIRSGRFGSFISCSGFPECKYRRSLVNKVGVPCPLCGGDLVERKTRQKRRVFYGCGNYPTCNFAIWEKPVPETCPNCNGLMVIPRGGQTPVCYDEVIVKQRSAEEQPPIQETVMLGTASENGMVPTSGNGQEGAIEVEKNVKTRARATSTKKKATTKKTAAKKTATSTAKATTTRKTTKATKVTGRKKVTGNETTPVDSSMQAEDTTDLVSPARTTRQRTTPTKVTARTSKAAVATATRKRTRSTNEE